MLGLVHSDETNQIPDRFELTLPSGHAIGEPELLFRTISEEEVAALRKRFGGTQDEAAANAQAVEPVFAADLRVGEVRDVQPHPESADRLWILSVGMGGDDVRQIVAGVREHYAQPADLLGRKVVIVCNLRPASLRGVESQGMMLCAAKKDDFGLLLAPADAAPGSRVFAGELRNPGEEVSAHPPACLPSLPGWHPPSPPPPACAALRCVRRAAAARGHAVPPALCFYRDGRECAAPHGSDCLCTPQWGSRWKSGATDCAHAYPGRPCWIVLWLALTQCHSRGAACARHLRSSPPADVRARCPGIFAASASSA